MQLMSERAPVDATNAISAIVKCGGGSRFTDGDKCAPLESGSLSGLLEDNRFCARAH